MSQPTFDPGILLARFTRCGGDSDRTKRVDNLPPENRKMLLREAALEAGEEPLIAYLGGSGDWLLLTTLRILHAGPGGRMDIRLVDLIKIDHDLAGEAKKHGPGKSLYRQLTIEGIGGRRIVADVEPGEPFYTLWNTLIWPCNWATAHRKRGLA
ncbi:MAG: hypothetical protein HKM95_13155 [Inquilinus sp.]|nr:hypothetical protein [Inquilinus sp.]